MFGRGNFLGRTLGDSVTLRLMFSYSTEFTLTLEYDLGNLPCPIAYQVFSVNTANEALPTGFTNFEFPAKSLVQCQQEC